MSEQLGAGATRSNPQKRAQGGVGETIKVIVQALLIAVVIKTLVFQSFNIPSGSMIPTLEIGDFVFVSKFSYGYSRYSIPFAPNLFSGRIFASEPKRGDVVVFRLPRDPTQDYVKRLIGLPGDRIQMKKGRLYINEQIVPREPIAEAVSEDRFGHTGKVPTYRETLPGGVAHTIIEIEGDSGFSDNTGVFEVPSGHYFMMGDNRDNSSDSRISPDMGGVGFVPAENLVGPAQMIYFSVKEGEEALQFWRWPWSLRFGRLFHLVR